MQPHERASFDADELAIVLSHYDLGVIATITDFPRGSRHSPKAGLVTERGKFVIKRRTLDHRRVERVRFAHGVQRHLLHQGFPIARVIRTRDDHGFLHLHEHLYEVFEFVPGHTYEATESETRDAGRRLAQFHAATTGYEPLQDIQRPRGDFHNAQAVCAALGSIGPTLRSHDSLAGNEAELAGLTVFLLDWYERAAAIVNRAMPHDEPDRVVHSDWHPGNLLFRNGEVLAVIDFDAVRYAQRVIDLANGLLQFSILGRGDPAQWPEQLDEARFLAFAEGFAAQTPLAEWEAVCIPRLMGEALIAECVGPIVTTGSVGRWPGYRMLQMVRRKLHWLDGNAQSLTERLGSLQETEPRPEPPRPQGSEPRP